MADDKKSTEIPLPKDGNVDIIAEPTVTEKEIAEDLNWITVHLDAMYWPLTDAMKPFQEEWDRCGDSWVAKAMLLKKAKDEGSQEGAAEWFKDLGDLFDGESWEKVGTWIGDATSAAADRISEYAKEQKKKVEELLEKPGETVFNWTWWAKQAFEAANSANNAANSVVDSAKSTVKAVQGAVDTVSEASKTAAKTWKHREAIAKLPEILASGESKKLQEFVDTVLMDIDPKMAEEISKSPDFHAVLELVDDPEGVLTYLEYASLMLEAIPPNFYAYVGGKAGTYIAMEILLMVALALLGGVGVAARVVALTARLTSTAKKVANVALASQKIARAVKAIEALTAAITRLAQVAGDLRTLGHKLPFARRRNVRKSVAAKNTAHVNRKGQKRERRCALCHSTKHDTPPHRRGNVHYN